MTDMSVTSEGSSLETVRSARVRTELVHLRLDAALKQQLVDVAGRLNLSINEVATSIIRSSLGPEFRLCPDHGLVLADGRCPHASCGWRFSSATSQPRTEIPGQ